MLCTFYHIAHIMEQFRAQAWKGQFVNISWLFSVYIGNQDTVEFQCIQGDQ